MTPPVKRAPRRPKIPVPPFDVAQLRGALVVLLMIAAGWERGAGKPRAGDDERERARREDEDFLRRIHEAVFTHRFGALLALDGKQQIIPYDLHLAKLRKPLVEALWKFRRKQIDEETLISRLLYVLGEEHASADELRNMMRLPEIGPDGSQVRDVRAWIEAAGGAQNAAAKLITRFRDRAGRFSFAAEKAVKEQPFGAGALEVRSRGTVVLPHGVPRYVLECLGYPEAKIEAAVTSLHGPRRTPRRRSTRTKTKA